MNFDELTICKRCGSDASYTQEVNENISITQCYGCGFLTNSLLKKGNDFFNQQMEVLPNLYKELMGEDEEGNIWMPTTINIPAQGMIFANGTGIEDWKWSAVKAVPVTEEDKEKYPIPGQKGQFYKHRMDMTTMKLFEEKDFIEALDYIGVFNPQK